MTEEVLKKLTVLRNIYKMYCTILLVGILTAFNPFTNMRILLNTEKRQIDCIHGIRFLSFTWVLVGHSYYFMSIMLPFDNFGDLYRPVRVWNRNEKSYTVLYDKLNMKWFKTIRNIHN